MTENYEWGGALGGLPGIRGNLLAAPPLPACLFSLPWGWFSRPSFYAAMLLSDARL